MEVDVIKIGSNIRATFNFSSLDEIPLEILQHVDKVELVKRMKSMKISLLENIIEGLTEQYQDETNPKKMMQLMAKIKEGEHLLEHIKNNDCGCNTCKEGNTEAKLKDILDMNGINMN